MSVYTCVFIIVVVIIAGVGLELLVPYLSKQGGRGLLSRRQAVGSKRWLAIDGGGRLLPKIAHAHASQR